MIRRAFGSKNLLALGSTTRKEWRKQPTKDSDGSTNDASMKNIHGTTTHTTGGDEGSTVGDVASKKRRGDMNSVIEPRSHRDVLMNGGKQQTMTQGQHTCDDVSIARKENKLQLVSDF